MHCQQMVNMLIACTSFETSQIQFVLAKLLHILTPNFPSKWRLTSLFCNFSFRAARANSLPTNKNIYPHTDNVQTIV